MAAGGDLRQVGDAEHLVVGGEFADLARHRLGRLAADPGVDLVENDGVDHVATGEQALQRQHQP